MSHLKSAAKKDDSRKAPAKHPQNATANSPRLTSHPLQSAHPLKPADMMHLQRTIGNQAALRLLAQRQAVEPVQQDRQTVTVTADPTQIQRWSIETGWGLFSSKGHELITQESVKQLSVLIDNDDGIENKQEIKDQVNKVLKNMRRGAKWNDLLGHHSIVSMGLAMKKKSSLTHQSHEGELQFLHGMAANKAEEAWQTQRKIMLWAEFCYKIATGVINPATELQNINVRATIDFSGTDKGIADLFANWGGKTVSWLFTNKKNGDASKVKAMALGSMLHMLQDTYCASHSQRVAGKRQEEMTRKIKGFNIYTEQSASLLPWKSNRHAKADKLKEQNVNKTAGANEAAEIGSQVLLHYKKNADWDTVVKPFLGNVFALIPELEQQRPQDSQTAQTAPRHERMTSASGRQFRKKWLFEEFKDRSKVRGHRRPGELKTIDVWLKYYADRLKVFELDSVVDIKSRNTRKFELEQELGALDTALSYARQWRSEHSSDRSKSMLKRIAAVDWLRSEIYKDRNEIQFDLRSLPPENEGLD